MITTIRGHRRINFLNGCTLSIFNGFGSYSENHFNREVKDKFIINTKQCEIAIIRNNIFITNDVLGNGGSVKGYVSEKELKEIIKKVREYDFK